MLIILLKVLLVIAFIFLLTKADKEIMRALIEIGKEMKKNDT